MQIHFCLCSCLCKCLLGERGGGTKPIRLRRLHLLLTLLPNFWAGQNVNVHLNADVSISHLTSVYLVQLIICQDCPREWLNLPQRLLPVCQLLHCVGLDMVIWRPFEMGLSLRNYCLRNLVSMKLSDVHECLNKSNLIRRDKSKQRVIGLRGEQCLMSS